METKETTKYITKTLKKEFPKYKVDVKYLRVALFDTAYEVDEKTKTIKFLVYFGALRTGKLWLKETIQELKNKLD
jgi:hypothetical protein